MKPNVGAHDLGAGSDRLLRGFGGSDLDHEVGSGSGHSRPNRADRTVEHHCGFLVRQPCQLRQQESLATIGINRLQQFERRIA